MPKTAQTPKRDPAEQYRRFLDTAKQVGAEETEEAFDRAFGRVVKPSEKPEKPVTK
jgi:hypothetical protein